MKAHEDDITQGMHVGSAHEHHEVKRAPGECDPFNAGQVGDLFARPFPGTLLNVQEDQRTYPVAKSRGIDIGMHPADDAGHAETLEPAVAGRARDLGARGELGDRGAAVLDEEREHASVDGI